MRRLRLIDTLYLLGNVQTISLLIFVSITSIGCIWQFISLVQLYLTYPTTVQIDTQFDVHKDSLAAFSLCRNTFRELYNHTGRSTDELFDHYSKLNVVDKVYLEGPYFHVDIDMQSLLTRVDRMSLSFFCVTFQGNIN